MADKLTIVFADPQELLGANDRIVFENDFDESISLSPTFEDLSIQISNAPGVPGPPGPPGPNGQVDPDDFAEIAEDAAEATLEALEPPIDLTLLFNNALA